MRLTLAIAAAVLLYSIITADIVARGYSDAITPLYNTVAKAHDYALIFNLPHPELDATAALLKIGAEREAREARNNTPAKIKRREAAKAAREAKAVQEIATAIQWRGGEL